MKPKVCILKIGGAVIDDEKALSTVLDHFSKIPGNKILVHGGGRLATELAEKLNLPQQMIEGRRVTDLETLKIATMVYAGFINKNVVAKLIAKQVSALGACGADQNIILAKKRYATPIDYGYVGDVAHVNAEVLANWLGLGIAPVISPITHDGEGQLLNTNADTIAQEIAKALASRFEVTLIYSFEKAGVLLDVENEASLIPEITYSDFQNLKAEKKVFAGMIPKLENAFKAIHAGVKMVILGKAEQLPEVLEGKTGTRLIYGNQQS